MRLIAATLISAGAVMTAAPLAGAGSATSTVRPELRWEGHSARLALGSPRPCRRDPCGGPRHDRFPIGGGAWIRIVFEGSASEIRVRLARVSREGVRYVGPVRVAGRHSDIRWQTVLPRDLRRANAIELSVRGDDGAETRFHTFVTR